MAKVKFKYLAHAHTGHVLRFTADVTLNEQRTSRLTFEEVRSVGAERFHRGRSTPAGEGSYSSFG